MKKVSNKLLEWKKRRCIGKTNHFLSDEIFDFRHQMMIANDDAIDVRNLIHHEGDRHAHTHPQAHSRTLPTAAIIRETTWKNRINNKENKKISFLPTDNQRKKEKHLQKARNETTNANWLQTDAMADERLIKRKSRIAFSERVRGEARTKINWPIFSFTLPVCVFIFIALLFAICFRCMAETRPPFSRILPTTETRKCWWCDEERGGKKSS